MLWVILMKALSANRNQRKKLSYAFVYRKQKKRHKVRKKGPHMQQEDAVNAKLSILPFRMAHEHALKTMFSATILAKTLLVLVQCFMSF